MKGLWLLALGWCLTVPARSGEISGQVTDTEGKPLQVTVYMVHDETGEAFEALADEFGYFELGGLQAGRYLVFPEVPIGYHVAEPECGWYFIPLATAGHVFVSYRLREGGVSVDFGKPVGKPDDPPDPFGAGIGPSGRGFHLNVYAANFAELYPAYPNRITIRGVWVDAMGPVDIDVADGSIAGLYRNRAYLEIEQGPGFHTEARILLEEVPGFSQNGLLARLWFQVPWNWPDSRRPTLCFCAEVTLEGLDGDRLKILKRVWCGEPDLD
ncbi:Carboxypeptidase regulatory-like domain-containing protein [Sulfidibacter corallicola]|uniref:Carboxypeptidase regulatory-like domain-containing protein n=1 Tax=Sulfidibacter corallicola TaxID=2818388 RepID=A0A8A4TPC9_SULCO|nr:carboxypeptidase-like regulatory domain-containing protein [Sulfidibacter corallicola]QTD51826.1 carboxypeptidase regulatory-like domain-containing protein [Sulfidibacter corallicola]